jgi:SAM-dependent methyltransferase
MASTNQIDTRSDGGDDVETLSQCGVCGSSRIVSVDPANRICECAHCGYVFDNPRPTFAKIAALYSRAEQYDPWLAEETARTHMWQRRLAIVRRYRSGGTLLDVGTGTGQFLAVARPYFEARGTEISRSGARIAREEYGVKVAEGQIEDISFDSKFDVITMFHVLEHVPNPSSTIKKCRELLKENGILVVAVPNEIGRPRSIVRRWCGSLGIERFRTPCYSGITKLRCDGSLNEIHLSHFTPAVLKGLLRMNGFATVSCTPDPYFVFRKEESEVGARTRYLFFLAISTVLGLNLYDTVLAVARPIHL